MPKRWMVAALSVMTALVLAVNASSSVAAAPGEVVVAASFDGTPAAVIVRDGFAPDGFVFTSGPTFSQSAVVHGVRHDYPAGDDVELAGDTIWVGTPLGNSAYDYTAYDEDAGGAATDAGIIHKGGSDDVPLLVAFTPHAFLVTEQDDAGLHIELRTPGTAMPVQLHTIPITNDVPIDVLSAQADGAGAVIAYNSYTGSGSTYGLGYLAYNSDGSDPTWTDLASTTGMGYALTPHTVAFTDGSGQIERLDRSTMSVLSSQSSQNGMLDAATDDAVAIETFGGDQTSGAPGPSRVITCDEPAGPCGSLLLGRPNPRSGQGQAGGVAAVGDHFAAPFGDTASTRAVRALGPAADAPGPVITGVTGAPPLSVSLGAGTLGVHGGSSAYQQAATSSLGRAVLGRTLQDGGGGHQPLFQSVTSGHRTAFVRCAVTSCSTTQTVVVDDGVIVRTLPGGVGAPSLSGDRVLVPGIHASELYTLDSTGAKPARPAPEPAYASMYGDRIVWATSTHAVMLRDLARPRSRDVVLRPPAAQPNCELQPQAPEISANWVLWDYDCERDLAHHHAYPTVVHLAADDHVDKTVVLPVEQREGEAHLTDGAVALIEAGDLTAPALVHVIDLRSGADHVVGTARPEAPNATYLAASDELVAWISPDNLVHLLPNPVRADAGPELFGSTVTDAVSSTPPTKTGDLAPKVKPAPYSVEFDASRPLSAWTATLRDPRGHVVTVRHGSSGDGGVVLAWNGLVRGRAAAAGRYSWTLSGAKGPGGRLTQRGRAVSPRAVFSVAA